MEVKLRNIKEADDFGKKEKLFWDVVENWKKSFIFY